MSDDDDDDGDSDYSPTPHDHHHKGKKQRWMERLLEGVLVLHPGQRSYLIFYFYHDFYEAKRLQMGLMMI